MTKTAKSTSPRALKSLEIAKQASLDTKRDANTENPPKWRNFSGKDFSKTSMIDIAESGVIVNGDFSGANLTEADFTYTQDGIVKGFILQGCNFKGATLGDTNFAGCDLRWSTFDTGTVDGTCFFVDFDDDGNEISGSAANLREVDGVTR